MLFTWAVIEKTDMPQKTKSKKTALPIPEEAPFLRTALQPMLSQTPSN